jgi:hypothetical protein
MPDRTAAETNGYPKPEEVGIDRRVLGALFDRKSFLAVGRVQTKRLDRVVRSGVARSDITVYRLRGEE